MEEKAEAEEEKAEDLVKRIPPDLSEEVAEDYLKELTNSKYCPKYSCWTGGCFDKSTRQRGMTISYEVHLFKNVTCGELEEETVEKTVEELRKKRRI